MIHSTRRKLENPLHREFLPRREESGLTIGSGTNFQGLATSEEHLQRGHFSTIYSQNR
jgi:hypothetical protein